MWFNDDTPDPIDGELAETRAETPTNADPIGGELSEGASTDNGSGPSATNDAWWNEGEDVPPVEGQPAPEEPVVPPVTPDEPVVEQPIVPPTTEEPIPPEGESGLNARAWWNEDEPSDDDDDDEDKNKKKGDDDSSDDDDDDNTDDDDEDKNKKKDGDNKDDDDDTTTKDAWWNEDETPADPTGALEPGVDNGNGLAQPAEPPTPENGDPGTGVDTENQNGETVTKATDWWNEDNTPESPTGTLPDETNNNGNADPAEQVPEGTSNAWWNEDDNNDDDNDLNSKKGEDNKGANEPNAGCKNWWTDDVEEPEGSPNDFGTEPVTVETPEGTVDPNGDPDPGDAVHVEGVETPAEDQPNQTAEQMLENILQTRLF